MGSKIIFLFLLFVTFGFAGQWLQGRVVKVSDGDTFHMMVGGKKQKIRLSGIDCPESKQEFGPEATRATDSLIYGKEVKVEVVDTDRYGRLVGDVWVGGINLNKWLVAHGYAWWYKHYAPLRTDLADAQAQAHKEHLGLWVNPSPTPPWDFRRSKRSRSRW